MFTILYILMVSNGVYFLDPIMEFESYHHCEEVREQIEYYNPEWIMECVEYRDA